MTTSKESLACVLPVDHFVEVDNSIVLVFADGCKLSCNIFSIFVKFLTLFWVEEEHCLLVDSEGNSPAAVGVNDLGQFIWIASSVDNNLHVPNGLGKLAVSSE